MTRFRTPSRPLTLSEQVNEMLEQAEAHLVSLRGSGAAAMQVLFLLDQAAEQLRGLKEAGADVRAEEGYLASVKWGLERKASVFLREVGPALKAGREQREAESLGPWWWIDRVYARRRRRLLARRLLIALVVVLVAVVGWLAYRRFLAPSPEVRQARDHIADGEAQLMDGNLEEALEDFEAAVALTPNDLDTMFMVGVLRQELGDEEGAQRAYETIRGRGISEKEFFLQRGHSFFQIRDLEAALADAERVIALDPNWGYGFYLRGSVEAAAGDTWAAVDDYMLAADLAHTSGDAQLEGLARLQRALLFQTLSLEEE